MELIMISYERLLTFGDFINLNISCDPDKLIREISKFPFSQYNPRKPHIKREGLSVTSIDGRMNGLDLDSIPEYNKQNDTQYDEMSFDILTKVYDESAELRKLVDPFEKFIGRTHFLSIKNGGYFPPHRDSSGYEEQETLRIVVPIRDMNPPKNYWIYDNKEILSFVNGMAYFLNTNKEHTVMSYSNDNLMLVMNIKSCSESHKLIMDRINHK
jgi:hypothetical protein